MGSITNKNQKFIDEYFVDLNATKAAIRAGYSSNSARQIATELLSKPVIKAEVARRMKENRMSSDELIQRLKGMAEGSIPTRTVTTGKDKTVVHDVLAASEKVGKIYALFIDKQVIELEGLEIIDDDEES